MSRSLYALLDNQDEYSFGPVHKRIATIFEVVRGHTSVLAEFRRRPGRWLLWIDVDEAPCPNCGENSRRCLQFAFLEAGASVIGECSANRFLHERWTLRDSVIDVGHAMSSELTNGTPFVLRLADGKKIWAKPWRLQTQTTFSPVKSNLPERIGRHR